MSVTKLTWLLLVTSIGAIEVNITSEWKPELGWKVMCNWQTLDNDTLQSVRLYNNGQQFMIYRPEKHGHTRNEIFNTPEKKINVNCALTRDRGQEGFCNLLLEPYQPPISDFTYSCEVSGERPMFRIGKKDFAVKILVPPSDAEVVSHVHDESLPSRVMLNCSSTGLPAPNLQWTVDNDKLQADFTGRIWNATSKLWKVWSYLSYTRIDDSKVLCRPEIIYNGDIFSGKPAEFNSARRLLGTSVLSLSVLFLVTFIR
ncbi:hypothetical protein KGM_207231 [Danaus plexippus plexippus]|uniref:Uncharacterized protein n=1 Tax=Danaus plexippus plexippus TaxID=278856 RepID=A0A212EW80_DANPL|nr:hypothetical protein KGM_207231 [Danaus plexippus plexippus]